MGQDCKYCGAYVAGSADKCPACGKRINYKAESGRAYAYAEPEVKTKQEAEAESEQKTYTYKDEYEKRYEAKNESRNTQSEAQTSAAESSDAKDNQLISFLCYFGILFLIPYLLRPNSDFVKFHSNQGLILLVAEVILNVVSEFVPFLGWLVGLVGGIFLFACFLKGLINVYHFEKKELPVIGSFRLLK